MSCRTDSGGAVVEQKILYVADVAAVLGVTPKAVSRRIERVRRNDNSRPVDLPPFFRFGGKWAWHKDVVDLWLKNKASPGLKLLRKS